MREDISLMEDMQKLNIQIIGIENASRRDFSNKSIYADKDGNLFDPNGGAKHLEKGKVNFIGDPDQRIKEDYLKNFKIFRFFLSYSKQCTHDLSLQKSIKQNLDGIVKYFKGKIVRRVKKNYFIKKYFNI